MPDPIIEAVARAMFAAEDDPILWCDHTDETRNAFRNAARIAAKIIRANVLEEAAVVADDFIAANGRPTAYNAPIAAAIRSLKEPKEQHETYIWRERRIYGE